MWINYLETWLHSENTSCYYTSYDQIFESASLPEKRNLKKYDHIPDKVPSPC
jgi:hypothetical protein